MMASRRSVAAVRVFVAAVVALSGLACATTTVTLLPHLNRVPAGAGDFVQAVPYARRVAAEGHLCASLRTRVATIEAFEITIPARSELGRCLSAPSFATDDCLLAVDTHRIAPDGTAPGCPRVVNENRDAAASVPSALASFDLVADEPRGRYLSVRRRGETRELTRLAWVEPERPRAGADPLVLIGAVAFDVITLPVQIIVFGVRWLAELGGA